MLADALPDGRTPVLLSAHHPELIRQDAAAILRYLDRAPVLGDPADVPAAVAATLLRLRRVRRHRAVVRAADRAELAAALAAVAGGDEHPLVARSSTTTPPRIAFVFPGQGNQWPGMGADAYRRLPAYRAAADRCAQAFVDAETPSPLAYLAGADDRDWSRREIQGAQFTHAVGLAAAWQRCGVAPQFTVGHSLGEVAAAYVAGTVTLPDAVALVVARANVVGRLTGRYAMAVLGIGAPETEALLSETLGWLEISAVNGPSSTVIAGDHDAVTAATRLARERDVFAHQLAVDYPGHTSALRGLRADLAELTPRSAFREAAITFVGSTFGAEVNPAADFTDYWYQNLCGTVRFDLAVQRARELGADTFVELSAHPSLLYPLAGILGDDAATVTGSGHRDTPPADALSAGLAALGAADPACDWAPAVPAANRPPLRGFPNAPMRAVHLWVAPDRLADAGPPAPALTVAVEDWQAAAPVADRPGALTIGLHADESSAELARRITEAIAAQGDSRVVAPVEAEILVVIAPALDHTDPAAAIDHIGRRPDAGLPDYAGLIGPRCRAVWLLTARAEQVGATAEAPAQAALAAMHRSVGFEFPDQAFGHLDLADRDVDARTAHAVVAALRGEASEVAVRAADGHGAPQRYVRTFRDGRGAAIARPLDAATLDNVVITGGSGAIGLHYARLCLERGANTVVLLSRNGVDPEALRRLTDSRGAGVRVHAPRCDITDRAALAAAGAEYGGSGASLLIHTAGVAVARPRAELTGADVAAVSAAKVRGLALLAESWPLRPDCRILACSSVFGVWGGYTHAAYAASNRMLDVLAAQLRAAGRDCTAIRWGLWQDAGVVVGDEIARTERSGLVAMDPARALDASLYGYGGDPLIFDADFDRLRVFFESQGMPMPFSAVEPGQAAGADATPKPLAEVVRAELAATLHLDGSVWLDPSTSLIDLGVDSLLALDLRKRLRRTVGGSVPVARMLGGITVGELIEALLAQAPATPPERPAATGTQRSPLAMLERLDS